MEARKSVVSTRFRLYGAAEDTCFQMLAPIGQLLFWRKFPSKRKRTAATGNRFEFFCRDSVGRKSRDAEFPAVARDSKKSGIATLGQPASKKFTRDSYIRFLFFQFEFQACKKTEKCYRKIAKFLDSGELGVIRFRCGYIFALFLSALSLANAATRQN